MNQKKMGIVLSYVSLLIKSFSTIFFTPLLLRILGQEEYGLYQMINSLINYLSLLSLGLGSAYIRYYHIYLSKNNDEMIHRLNGFFLKMFCLIGIVSLGIGVIITVNTNTVLGRNISTEYYGIAKIMMSLAVINVVLSLENIIFDSYITVNERFIIIKFLSCLRNIGNPLLTYILLHMSFGVVSIFLANTIIGILYFIYTVVYCIYKLKMKFIFSNIENEMFKDIFIFSFFIFLNMLIDQINWNIDNLLLGWIKGAKLVTIYSIGAQINSLFRTIAGTISSVYVPQINKMISSNESNNKLLDLMVQVGRIQFMISQYILGITMAFGKNFIILWCGKIYEDAYYIAIVLMIPIMIPLVQSVGVEIQRAKNKHKFRSIIYFIIAICNVIISVPLIDRYGPLGAAIGTCISVIIGNGIIMNIYYHKKLKLNMIYFWENFSSFIIPSLSLFILINLYKKAEILVNSWYQLIVLFLIYTIIFLFILYFEINKYERVEISKFIKKIGCHWGVGSQS